MSDDKAAKKEKARQRRLATARDLEGRGHVDHAVKEFLRAKVPGEAARLLAKQGRLKDAGQAILDGLKVKIDEVGQLSENDRALVEQVVLFFEHGHEGAKAEQLKNALASAPPPEPGLADRALSAAPAEPAAGRKPERISKPPARKEPVKKEPPPPTKTVPKEPEPAAAVKKLERKPVKNLPDADEFVPSEKKRPVGRSATMSGSFRPPAKTTTSSGGFRAPSNSGSFRPPARPVTKSEPKVERPMRPSPAVITGTPTRADEHPARPIIATGSFAIPKVDTGSSRPPGRPAITTGSFAPPKPESVPPEAKKASSKPPRRSTPAPEKPASKRPPKVDPVRPALRPPRSSEPQLSASGEVITEYAGKREQGWRGAGSEAIEKSIEEHLAAGRKGAAARIARDAGQYDRALVWFEELALHHQAGACLRAIGRYEEALVMLMKQDPKGGNYRKACFELIAVAKELETKLDFDIDRFLTRFVEQGPADRDEVSTYVDLAHLYLANDFTSGAKRCLRKILASDPGHIEAKELDEKLRRTARESSAEMPRRPSMLPASARGLPPLPTLEEFVELARAHAPTE